ncbi:MAG TPA: phosphoenolpyruvate carboxykinase, partial [Thermoanaerobaculia bacterium]|nr:phosphoenolpyruvate carboxykinase [Thermoanaerobaculia bacterium]
MATVEVLSPRTIRARRILKDLSRDELRELARSDERTSEYGSPVYTTRVKSRSAKDTYVVANGVPIGVMQKPIDRRKAEDTIRQVQEAIADMELIQVDRRLGMSPDVPIHCRLFVPREYARIAYMWHNMLFPSSSANQPDFISVYVPDWKERLIFLDVDQGYTYILGSDYPGEAKKSMLRQAMYWIKRRGGLGLHAGSKVLRVVGPDGELRDVGFLLFGLSGTGKTTLTLHDHGLEEPERAIIKQDDVVLMTADGKAYGTEDGFYIKTEGLEPSQAVLWGAATHPTAVYENIKLHGDGKVDFLDTSLTSNGRGVVLRKYIRGTGEGIDLEMANKIVFITRRNDVVPVCARLTAEQAAAYFMLGESIETSAGDPTKAGQAKREVGTNPFIVGPEADEGNRLLSILRTNPDMQAYILNTGSIGATEGSPGEKITIRVS